MFHVGLSEQVSPIGLNQDEITIISDGICRWTVTPGNFSSLFFLCLLSRVVVSSRCPRFVCRRLLAALTAYFITSFFSVAAAILETVRYGRERGHLTCATFWFTKLAPFFSRPKRCASVTWLNYSRPTVGSSAQHGGVATTTKDDHQVRGRAPSGTTDLFVCVWTGEWMHRPTQKGTLDPAQINDWEISYQLATRPLSTKTRE